ncbi:MAG: NAD-dependent epimerase/dehydratase family protein [Patescibacteria group bacterium]
MDKKNIVVTGGAGFIGSHLCEALLKGGDNIICIDNFINSNPLNIDHLLKSPSFELIKHDINEPIDLEKYTELEKFKVKFTGIQEIYHQACPTSAKNFEKFKMDTLFTNSLGMKNILDLAVKYKAKIVHGSTSVVYGPRTKDKKKFNEEDFGVINHLSERGCYDEGKRFAETCVETYREVHGLEVGIARIFRTYGPRQRLYDGEMVPDFITDAIDGKDLVIYGDKTFTTSLTYVSDIVDGLVRMMAYSGGYLGPVNLGSDQDVSLVEVAERIIKMTNSGSKIVFEDPLLFMTPLGLPDIRKAKEELGWFPLVRLEDGLEKSVEYALAKKQLLGLR